MKRHLTLLALLLALGAGCATTESAGESSSGSASVRKPGYVPNTRVPFC